jgi:hypothetical protein
MERGTRRTVTGATTRRGAAGQAPGTAGWTAAGVVLLAAASLSALFLPEALVLLATGSALVIVGFAVASVLVLAGRRMGRDATTGWDAAAALVFLGFAAALLADTGAALSAFAELRAR